MSDYPEEKVDTPEQEENDLNEMDAQASEENSDTENTPAEPTALQILAGTVCGAVIAIIIIQGILAIVSLLSK